MNKKILKSIKIAGTQDKLAKKVEASQASIGLWLKGCEFSAKYAYRIEKATGAK